MPAYGALRAVTATTGPEAGRTFVEAQVNPFPIRHTAQAVPFGLPTFYIVLDAGASAVAFANGDVVPAGEPLATVAAASVLCAGQDRVARDPALWARQILEAIPAADRAAWQPFADAIAAQTASVPVGRSCCSITAAHRSRAADRDPIGNGDRDRRSDRGRRWRSPAHRQPHARGEPGLDAPDERAARGRRRGAAPAAPRRRGRAARAAGGRAAFGRRHDRRHSRPPACRPHQSESVVRAAVAAPPEPLQRYTRNNRLVPLVNGRECFDHLFRALHDAATANPPGGLHLVGGWQTFPDTELTERRDGEPADLPLSLEQAAELIGAAGGATRFLSPSLSSSTRLRRSR